MFRQTIRPCYFRIDFGSVLGRRSYRCLILFEIRTKIPHSHKMNVDQLNSQLTDARVEIAQLKTRIAQLEGKIIQLERKVTRLEPKVAGLEDQCLKLSSTFEKSVVIWV